MSDSDSGETIHTDSEWSEDSDEGDSLDDFIAEETTPQKFKGVAEIDKSNILYRKRRRITRVSTAVLPDTSSDDSDYV